jgi:hypothetical protein
MNSKRGITPRDHKCPEPRINKGMQKNELLYGREVWERLETTFDDAVERALEEGTTVPGESYVDVRGLLVEDCLLPMVFNVFRRRSIGGDTWVKYTANDIVERIIDDLDAEFAAPEGDPTILSGRVKTAALKLAGVIEKEYVSWQCEPTGQSHKLSREDLERWIP